MVGCSAEAGAVDGGVLNPGAKYMELCVEPQCIQHYSQEVYACKNSKPQGKKLVQWMAGTGGATSRTLTHLESQATTPGFQQ